MKRRKSLKGDEERDEVREKERGEHKGVGDGAKAYVRTCGTFPIIITTNPWIKTTTK